MAERLLSRVTRTVVDVGCGIGRFAHAVGGRTTWIGVDSSPRQLRDCGYRPVVRADAVALAVASATVDAVTMLWMLHHLDDPRWALAEGRRVLRPGGVLVACTASRHNDRELAPDGYPPTTFDAEEAADIVADVFGGPNVDRWDEPLVTLHDDAEVAAYARAHLVAASAIAPVRPPLTLTKRGCVIWATRS